MAVDGILKDWYIFPVLAALLLSFLTSCSFAATSPQTAKVLVPLVDVWSKTATDPTLLKDSDRETQLLQDERVLIHEVQGEWARIEAVEQPEFTHHSRWEGYPGWVLKTALHISTAAATPASDSPSDILRFAGTLLGSPYQWGGLGPKGIDCSGLTHLAYRRHHHVIPRDSHEQWMKAKAIRPKDLKPGDLIFSGKPGTPVKISHVTLYAGEGQIIEAPQTGMGVRRISFVEKYGKPLSSLHNGSAVGDRVIYFGTYLY